MRIEYRLTNCSKRVHNAFKKNIKYSWERKGYGPRFPAPYVEWYTGNWYVVLTSPKPLDLDYLKTFCQNIEVLEYNKGYRLVRYEIHYMKNKTWRQRDVFRDSCWY